MAIKSKPNVKSQKGQLLKSGSGYFTVKTALPAAVFNQKVATWLQHWKKLRPNSLLPKGLKGCWKDAERTPKEGASKMKYICTPVRNVRNVRNFSRLSLCPSVRPEVSLLKKNNSFGILLAFGCLLVEAKFDAVFLTLRRFLVVLASSVVFTTKTTLP